MVTPLSVAFVYISSIDKGADKAKGYLSLLMVA